MGSFYGHVLPGSFFIIAGLWWMYHAILEYAGRLKEQSKNGGGPSNTRSWGPFQSKRLRKIPLEPILKLFGCLVGIIVELKDIHFHLVDKNNEFVKPNKFAHSSMYGFFGLSGLIEILNFYKVTQFSQEAEYVILALAFSVEGTLFAFHLHGRDMFDVRIHTLLYIVIYLAAIVILLEACLPKFRRELFMARTVLVLTQGTWFWEIAITLYGKNKWFRDITDITEKQLMLDTEVMTVSIMWHLLYWSGVLLFLCIVTNCLYKCDKLPACCHGNTTQVVKSSSLLNRKFSAVNELSDEEEILLTRDSENNIFNKPSSELISNNIDEEASF